MFLPSLLTAQQRILVDMMRKRNNPIHVERLVEALYGARANGGPEYAAKVVRVQICQIRRRLAPHGITIFTVGGGEGYMINPAHVEALAALLENSVVREQSVA